MSDKRRQDPLKRTPPTIDLKAEIVPPKAETQATSPLEDAGTAIEATASTGLGVDSAPKAGSGTGAGADARVGTGPSAVSPAPKPGDAKAPDAVSKPASPVPSPGAPGPSATTASAPSGITKPAEPADPAKPAQATKPGEPAKPFEPAKPNPIGAAGASASAKKPDAPVGAKPADGAKPDQSPLGAGSSDATKTGHDAKPAEPPKPSATPSNPIVPRVEPEPPPAARSNAGAIFIAGLVGGVLGAVLTVGLTRFIPADEAAEQRLLNIERRVASLPTGPGPLEPRVTALEAGVRQAADEARAAAKQAAEALSRPSGSGTGPDQEARSGLQALTARVQDGVTRTTANTAALGELGQKLDGLGKSTADRMTAISRDVETFNVHTKSLQADVAALRTSTASLDARTGEADKRIVSLTDGLGRVSTDLAKVSPSAVQASLRVVVSGRLDDALRSGTPLGPATAALAKLGTDPAALAPLRPFAEIAAPSPAALLAEFKPLGAAMTTQPPRPDETWIDKGRRLVGKVVTVQAVGDGSGQDLPGLIARIESSLGRGAVPDAKAAWDKLPADKRSQSAAFGEKLTARAAAEDAVRRIGAQSLSALDAATR